MLGLADLNRQEIRLFPDKTFSDGSPSVIPESGEVLWCSTSDIWKMSPRPDSTPVLLGSLPADSIQRRFIRRVATQISLNAGGELIVLDSQIGQRCVLGVLDIRRGDYTALFSSTAVFNHAQFSPVNPRLMLLAHDDITDFTGGDIAPYSHRMYLFDLDGHLEPFGPSGRNYGHEFWMPDGTEIIVVDFRRGVSRVSIATNEVELIWPGIGWHAHASACGRYLVADHRKKLPSGERVWRIHFLNRETGKSIQFAAMPAASDTDRLHQHPHPRFGAKDTVIVYTSRVRGSPTPAIVAVKDLIEATT